MVTIINVSDFKNPNDLKGRSYRECNAELQHRIPIGTLVEIVWEEQKGVRLFVAAHTRDCDQTPLYSLTPDRDSIEVDDYRRMKWEHGYSEDSLKLVNEKQHSP